MESKKEWRDRMKALSLAHGAACRAVGCDEKKIAGCNMPCNKIKNAVWNAKKAQE